MLCAVEVRRLPGAVESRAARAVDAEVCEPLGSGDGLQPRHTGLRGLGSEVQGDVPVLVRGEVVTQRGQPGLNCPVLISDLVSRSYSVTDQNCAAGTGAGIAS